MIEDKVILTEDQERAMKELQEWWELPPTHEDYYNCIFSAPAGSGKTFLAKYFTRKMQNVYPLFTAMTNEAVRQLELAGVNAITTHSALGLFPNLKGEEISFYQKRVPEELLSSNLIIIDEASMASKGEGYQKLIIDYVNETGIRALWLGDKYQLPPIESNDGISPIFNQGYKNISISKVVRNSGTILTFCTTLRSKIDSQIKSIPVTPKGISKMPLSHFYKSLADKNILDEFKSGDRICIVWRNSVADEINKIIRNNIYGKELAKQEDYLPGDQIIFISPLMYIDKFPTKIDYLVNNSNLKIKASINTRAEIIKVEKEAIYNVQCHKCTLKIEGGAFAIAYIPTKEGFIKLKSLKSKILEDIKTMKKHERDMTWEKWHTLNSIFLKVKNSYVITTHRAQGSTIQNVVVNMNDILIGARKHKLLTYKMLYTAASRASKTLTLINN